MIRTARNIGDLDCSNLKVSSNGLVKTKNGWTPGWTTTHGYKQVKVQRKGRHAHQLILNTFYPSPLPGLEPDHINGNRTDNRLENLRWVSKSINGLLKQAKGFSKRNNKYQVCLRGKWIGIYTTTTEAKYAYEYHKAIALREAREELVGQVMDLGFTRQQAIDSLHWTEFDDIM